jgi:hypothetical protein
MGRRDPDPRPPIEIVGSDPTVESVQVVSTGPRGPRRTTGRALAVVAGVGLLLLVGLALGGDPDDGAQAADQGSPGTSESSAAAERTTTSRPRTTTTRETTTTTTIPVGPVFGESVGAGLLVFGPAGWQLVDLDTGRRTELALPGSPYEMVAVSGGVVSSFGGDRDAQLYAIERDGVSDPVLLGVADQVLPAGRPDRVWLIDGGGRVNEGGGLANETADVRLVDLRGEVLRSFQVAARYVTRGLEDGVVIERGGRVYVANEDGIRPLAVGWTVGTTEHDLLVLSCDDDASCGVGRHPVDGSTATRLVEVVDVENTGYESSTALDGRFALMATDYGAGDQSLLLFAPDGRPQGQLSVGPSGYVAPLRWLPDDLGLVATGNNQVHWIRPRDGRWISQEVPALQGISAEIVFLVEW